MNIRIFDLKAIDITSLYYLGDTCVRLVVCSIVIDKVWIRSGVADTVHIQGGAEWELYE